MKYFRLLNNTPNADAGSIFFELEGCYTLFDPNLGKSYQEVSYAKEDVENNDRWFERVLLIPVKPYNASKLLEIDDEADEDDRIAGPLVFERKETVQPDQPDPTCDGDCCDEDDRSDSEERDRAEEKEVSTPNPLSPLIAMMLAGLIAKRVNESR